MRRDQLLAALRRAKLAAASRRTKIAQALRALGASPPGERARRALAALRDRPDAVVALVLGAGVLAMVLHWG